MEDQQCTQCHGRGCRPRRRHRLHEGDRRLRARAPGVAFAVTVAGGGGGNGDARGLDDRARLSDNAQIKLNHAKHLKPGLRAYDELKSTRGSDGMLQARDGLQITCAYCPSRTRGARHAPSPSSGIAVRVPPLEFDGRRRTSRFRRYAARRPRLLRGVFSESFDVCQAVLQLAGLRPPATRARCQALELVKGPRLRRPSPSARGWPPRPPRGSRGGAHGRARGGTPRPARARAGSARRGPARRRAARTTGPRHRGRSSPAPAESWTVTQVRNAESLVCKQRCEFCHVLVPQRTRCRRSRPRAIPARWHAPRALRSRQSTVRSRARNATAPPKVRRRRTCCCRRSRRACSVTEGRRRRRRAAAAWSVTCITTRRRTGT